MRSCLVLTMRCLTLLVVVAVWLVALHSDFDLAAQETEASVKVTLLAYSGRPNPVFELSENEIGILLDRLGPIPDRSETHHPKFPFWPMPGIAGFLLENNGVVGFPDRLHIYSDVISIPRPEGNILFEDTGDIDAWLVSLIKEKAIKDVPWDMLDGYADRSSLETQARYQASHVLARGIEKENVHIVKGEIIDAKGIVPSENDSIEGNLFQLVNLSVLETIRGDVGDSIFVLFSKELVENLRYKSFQPEAIGSRWILFLESPFDTEKPVQAEILEILKNVDIGEPLSPANVFTIYYHGYGSLCVEWPPSVARPKTLPIEKPEVVNDIKSILEIGSAARDLEADSAAWRQLMEESRTDFGQTLIKKVVEGR